MAAHDTTVSAMRDSLETKALLEHQLLWAMPDETDRDTARKPPPRRRGPTTEATACQGSKGRAGPVDRKTPIPKRRTLEAAGLTVRNGCLKSAGMLAGGGTPRGHRRHARLTLPTPSAHYTERGYQEHWQLKLLSCCPTLLLRGTLREPLCRREDPTAGTNMRHRRGVQKDHHSLRFCWPLRLELLSAKHCVAPSTDSCLPDNGAEQSWTRDETKQAHSLHTA